MLQFWDFLEILSVQILTWLDILLVQLLTLVNRTNTLIKKGMKMRERTDLKNAYYPCLMIGIRWQGSELAMEVISRMVKVTTILDLLILWGQFCN